MNDFFLNEQHSPLEVEVEEFDLVVGAVGHFRLPRGPILAPEFSYYTGLAWCNEGEMETFVDEIAVRYKASQVFILPSGVTHHTHVISDVSEGFFFAIGGENAWNTVLELGLWEGTFIAGNAPKEWFEFIMEKMPNDDSQSIGMNISVAKDLMRYVAKYNYRYSPDKLALDIETLLRQEWNNPELNVNYVLKKTGVHRTTASHKFKKRTGLTIIEYLNKVRITEAKRRLLNTTLPVKQVALDCGFTDPLYFSRLFSRNEKLSPKKFRSHKADIYND